MRKFYDVAITNKERNIKIFYLADSFSLDECRVLRIKSYAYGDVSVQIEKGEEITVNEIELKD